MLSHYLKNPTHKSSGKPIRGYCSCCSFPMIKVPFGSSLLPGASARYHKVFDSQRELMDFCPICCKRLDKTFQAEPQDPYLQGYLGIQIKFQQT
jgi:hypothetical protein